MGNRILSLKPEKMLGYSSFWAWWKRVENEAGVRHRKPHMMRHTCATDLLDATEGKPLRRPGTPRTLIDRRHRNVSAFLTDALEAAVTDLGEYRKRGSRENILFDDAQNPCKSL